MGYLWQFIKLNRAILYGTLGAFTVSTITPLRAEHQEKGVNFNLNDINFGIKIEKFVEKVKKCIEKKDSAKLTELMFDIKREVEGYTGQKIQFGKALDQVEKEIKSRGGKIDSKVMKKIKKDLEKKEKRANHKSLYMSNCLEFNLPHNAEEEACLFEVAYPIASSINDKDDEICVPLRVTIGVTVALCGVFLLFVPLPICKQYAPYMIEAGVALIVDEGITKWEEKDKKEKK